MYISLLTVPTEILQYMSRVDILRDGEDPIVVNGLGDRLQVPVCAWDEEVPEVEYQEADE